MTRFLLSTVAAAVLLAAPVAAFAQATPPAAAPAKPPAPAAAAPAKPVVAAHHARMARHATPARRMAPRDSGSAAVDALNDQALARARGTAQ